MQERERVSKWKNLSAAGGMRGRGGEKDQNGGPQAHPTGLLDPGSEAGVTKKGKV